MHRVDSTALPQLLHLLLGQLYIHGHAVGGHAIATHVVGCHAAILSHSLLSHQSLPLLLYVNLLLTHLSYSTWVGKLVLQLLLLQRLLLSRAHMLESSLKIMISAMLHGRHHGWIHTGGVASGHRVASKLMRHASARRAWLSTVGTHAWSHGMTGNAWMSHTGGMTLEVWAHTRGHHSSTSRSAIHRQRISTNVLDAMACTCVNGETSKANVRRNQ